MANEKTIHIGKKQQEGRLYRRPGSPYVWLKYYRHGVPIRVSSGTTDERKAAKILKRKPAEVTAGVHADPTKIPYSTMRALLFEDYQMQGHRSLRRDREGKPYLDKVNRLDRFFEGWLLSEIDTAALRQFAIDEQKRGRANGTINRSLAALRRMFHLGNL